MVWLRYQLPSHTVQYVRIGVTFTEYLNIWQYSRLTLVHRESARIHAKERSPGKVPNILWTEFAPVHRPQLVHAHFDTQRERNSRTKQT